MGLDHERKVALHVESRGKSGVAAGLVQDFRAKDKPFSFVVQPDKGKLFCLP